MSALRPARGRAAVMSDLTTGRVGSAGVPTIITNFYFELSVDYTTREINISGELDINTASCLATAIKGFQHRARADITIRLDHVTFIDAAGIRAVASASTAQLRQGARLGVTGVTADVRRAFTLGDRSELLCAC